MLKINKDKWNWFEENYQKLGYKKCNGFYEKNRKETYGATSCIEITEKDKKVNIYFESIDDLKGTYRFTLLDSVYELFELGLIKK